MTALPTSELPFTGERYTPDQAGNIMIEHIHRYLFALQFIVGLDVLDIACGEGYGSDLMGRVAKSVIGADISDEAIAHARAKYATVNVEFRLGSADKIPLRDASVDVVISFETIEHHDKHVEMLEEIKRVLRPGGLLIMSSPDKKYYSDARNFNNEFHVKELYKAEFTSLMHAHFSHVSLFGQKLVYGSAIFADGYSGGALTIPQGERRARAGFPDALYNIALASDDPARICAKQGSLMEFDLYKSEAMSERFHIEDQLRSQVERLAHEVSQHLSVSGESICRIVDYFDAAFKYKYDVIDEHIREKSLISQEYDAKRRESTARDRALAERKLQKESLGIFRWIVFHKSGKPRGWFRKMVLADRVSGEPRRFTRRVLLKKNGSVRLLHVGWYSKYLSASPGEAALAAPQACDQPTGAPALEHGQKLREIIASGRMARVRTVSVITTPHTAFVGDAIREHLAHTRLQCRLNLSMPDSFDDDLYVVVCPQMFSRLPPQDRRICFQMEQSRSSPWFTPEYLSTLRESVGVLDYSINNIEFLKHESVGGEKTFFVPIQPCSSLMTGTAPERDIDVLFYGAINGTRRRRFIDALSNRFNIRIETETFGPEITHLLKRAKIVVNVHFYEESLLETTRISEALSYGARVVSETARDQSHHSWLNDIVEFVPADDVEGFVHAVERMLTNYAPPDAHAIQDLDASPWGMRNLLLRAFNALGVLSYDEFESATAGVRFDADRVVLCLPESAERFRSAEKSLQHGAVLFPGLRHVDGWKGTALSYKYIASHALR